MKRSIASLGCRAVFTSASRTTAQWKQLSTIQASWWWTSTAALDRRSLRTRTTAARRSLSSTSPRHSKDTIVPTEVNTQTRSLCSTFGDGRRGSRTDAVVIVSPSDSNNNGDSDERNHDSDDDVDDDKHEYDDNDRYLFDDFDDDCIDHQADNGRNNDRQRRKSSKTRPYADDHGDFSSGGSRRHDDKNIGTKRLWLDPKSSIKDRVEIFVNSTPLGSLHPLDMTIGSTDLIRQSCKLDSFEGMKYAHDILDRLIDEKRHVNTTLLTTIAVDDLNNNARHQKPIVISDRPFKFVMFGWACMSHKVKVGPQRMREVLDLMIQEDQYDKDVQKEWEKVKATISLNKNKDTLDDVSVDSDSDVNTDRKVEDDFGERGCEPTVDIYNTLIQGLSNAAKKSIASAIEAEGVLSTMDKMYRTRGWHTRPNTRSYSLVLGAYANTRHATAGDRAETVLRDMTSRFVLEKQAYEEEYGVEYSLHDSSQNKRRIVTPDIVAYTTAMKAHAQSDVAGSAEKALALLSELLDVKEGEGSTEPPLTMLLEPDAFAFATVIQAYANMAARKRSAKDRFDAAQRAEEIALRMIEEIRKSKHNKKLASESEEEENEKEHQQEKTDSPRLSGSIVPFNSAINAWAQSYTKESADRAEALLFLLLDPETQDLIETQPDTVSFNSVAQAWAKAAKDDDSAPERAEEMLEILRTFAQEDDAAKDDGFSPVKKSKATSPDGQSYVAVMNAYANSRRKDRVYHVHRLLKELIDELPHKVTAVPYTVLFKAVANYDLDNGYHITTGGAAANTDWAVADQQKTSSSSTDPYAIALECYADLVHPDENDVQDTTFTTTKPKGRSVQNVDHFVFATMLDVVRRHTDSESIERRQRVEEIFYDACQVGQVSSVVVKALQSTCPSTHMLQELLQQRGRDSGGVTIETINILPREWIRNVPQDFRRVTTRKDHFEKSSKRFRTQKRTDNKNKKNHQRQEY